LGIVIGIIISSSFTVFGTDIIRNSYFNSDLKLVINNHQVPDIRIVTVELEGEKYGRNYYSIADCVVLPYKKIFQSGVLLMALSYKVPVIVSNLPGMLDLVEDEVTGFIFESESVESLFNVMLNVINSKSLLSISDRAYNMLASDYNWNVIGLKTFDIYKSLISS